jgi:hypothetical protein
LVTPWVTILIAPVQTMMAVTTRVRHEIDDGIQPLHGNQRPRMTRMAQLSAWFAAALHATTSCARPSREAVGGRRLRRRGRILLTQRELSFQIGDALGLLGNLALAFGEFPSQALDLLLQVLFGALALQSLGPRHVAHGTPIGSICTGP